jgi:hypothetical protein
MTAASAAVFTTTVHLVEVVRVQFADFVVQLGHLNPLLFAGGAIPSHLVITGVREAVGLRCDERHTAR